MAKSTFVFELGCEELPSSSLPSINQQLGELFTSYLAVALLDYTELTVIASPRRLGVYIRNLSLTAKEISFEKKGPAVGAAFQDGKPTRALDGFCRGLGITPSDTTISSSSKGDWVVYRGVKAGKPAREVLAEACDIVVGDLQLVKSMRWGTCRYQFLRPVQWILALHNEHIVPISMFGLTAGRVSYGHRFHAPDEIELEDSNHYFKKLQQAFVIPEFERRKQRVWESISSKAKSKSLTVEKDDALLTEVSCLVEWPIALCGEFNKQFLALPEIVLIAAMKGHQKYFHTRDNDNLLSNAFIAVANIKSTDPSQVIGGNQRVIHARLSDAQFFFQKDRERSLISRRNELDGITFHPKLGSLGDKTERLKVLMAELARDRKLAVDSAISAVELCRCDLVTQMVLEFDELQGEMGCIYASLDGESIATASAIEGLYRPRGPSDGLPKTTLGHLLALADRIDTLAGLFVISQPPSGSKDPFGLRRAAIGCLRLNEHPNLRLDLRTWIERAVSLQQVEGNDSTIEYLVKFVKDRERTRLLEQGYRHDIVSAVQALSDLATFQTEQKVRALQNLSQDLNFNALVSANKRVANLLKDVNSCEGNDIDERLFEVRQEGEFFKALEFFIYDFEEAVSRETFEDALRSLLEFKPTIDAFFDNVMINVKDQDIMSNRIALSRKILGLFLNFGDLTLIQSER